MEAQSQSGNGISPEADHAKGNVATIAIKPPNVQTAEFAIEGITPYMQHRFWKKAELMAKHQKGSKPKDSKKNREARDFHKEYQEATYRSADGWCGIPAAAIRQGCISACRLVGFKMTLAKLSMFVLADGFDHRDGTPLVKIDGIPQENIAYARNETGVIDLRARPLWTQWAARLRIRYDADQFSLQDVTNLLHRVGLQVGIGEGRPDSKNSSGLGYGLFDLK